MDNAKSKQKAEQLEEYRHDKDYDSGNNGQRELGEYINHAGRLLLNHGYLENAIKTENKMFLDNNTVKDILDKIWYGTDQFDFCTVS